MVTVSTGSNCRETDFSITASNNCSGYCKTDLFSQHLGGEEGQLRLRQDKRISSGNHLVIDNCYVRRGELF